jgi:CheY-like chemotaxis protein
MILVATSHAETREAIVPLIADEGYEVAGVECGDEVVRRARFRRPALVIIDCGLPDSFNLLARIRGEPTARQTPLVMFSIDDEDAREKALLTGADAYVPKGSLDWAELLLEIRRYAGPPTRQP